MSYSFFIARRLSLSTGRRKNSPAVSVAIAAVALSLAIMIISVAIVRGFQNEIRNKIVGYNGHITLYAIPHELTSKGNIFLSQELKEKLDGFPFIKDYSLQAAIPAIMKTPENFKGVYLKGLNGETTTEFINENLEEGSLVDFNLDENKDKVVISSIAAKQLGLKTEDKVDVYFLTDELRVRRLEIIGIFNTHFEQYDDVLIFGSLPLVRQLAGIDENEGTYLQIKTDDFNRIEEYSNIIKSSLNRFDDYEDPVNFYRIDNVLNQGMGFFSWLNLLDTNVRVIIILMLIVGCVTLVSGMLIIILEKKRFIGLMKALGAPNSGLRKVFVFIAVKIAVIGMLIGNVIGIGLVWIQDVTRAFPLDADSYYINFVPALLNFPTIVLLNAGVLVVVYLVLVLPSRFVASVSPAEVMRSE